MTLIEELSNLDINDIGSWSRRVKLVVALLVSVVILFAGYYFVVKDKFAELETVHREEQTLKNQFLEK